MDGFTIEDRVIIAGIGETTCYRRGTAPVGECRCTIGSISRTAVGHSLVRWRRVAKAD